MKKDRNRKPDSVFVQLLREMDTWVFRVWHAVFPYVSTAILVGLGVIAGDLYINWVKQGRPIGCENYGVVVEPIPMPDSTAYSTSNDSTIM